MDDENFKKGKLAEKIVWQMFKEAGFKVIPSGYESTFSELANRYNLIQGPAAQYIRHHPDFIVINPRNEAFLIEVKYRKFGIINQQDMFNFPETHVIMLTKDSMHCQSLKEIHQHGKRFLPLDCLRPFSNIPLDIRDKFIRKTRRILGDENLIGQLIERIAEKIVRKRFVTPNTSGQIKFTYVENFNKEGDSYERVGNEEIVTNQSGSSRFSNHGKQWNNNDFYRLSEYYKSGMSIDNIAVNLGRKKDAIIFKLVKTELLNIHQAENLLLGNNRYKNIHRKNKHKKKKHHRNRNRR